MANTTARLVPWPSDRIDWEDGEIGGTPLSATNLNKITAAIDAIHTWANSSGALTFDQLALADGTNKVELSFPKKPDSDERYGLHDYRVLFIKGWIQKNQGNNYSFTCTLPVSNLLDYGMFNVMEYDETYSEENSKYYGTISSIVIRVHRESSKLYLVAAPRDSVTLQKLNDIDITTGQPLATESNKEVVGDNTKLGAIGRWIHDFQLEENKYERRNVGFQEVYGLR